AVFTLTVMMASTAFAAPAAVIDAWPPDARDMDQKAAFKYSQSALKHVIRDAKFTDQNGTPISLEEFRGKPLVVSFVYTSCVSVCVTITDSLLHSLDVANETFGENEFNILTIGFDTSFDTPESMGEFAERQDAGGKNWKFLSGDILNVSQLADDLGFFFYRTPDGFDHLAQVTVINKEGKVYKQVYGETFDTPHLIEPLKDIIYHTEKSVFTPEGLFKKIKFYCTVYDPDTDRYYFDYAYFINLFAGITVMIIPAWVMVRTIRRTQRERKERKEKLV
ncbi:MAG: SCO family protein, partial [Alphaproteobacteria bacterium]|nr:SCO family protein [Alphaproteobacteria bacterium]